MIHNVIIININNELNEASKICLIYYCVIPFTMKKIACVFLIFIKNCLCVFNFY